MSKKQHQPKKNTPSGPSRVSGFFSRYGFMIALVTLVFLVFTNSIFNGYALDDEFFTNGGNELTNKGIKAVPEIFRSRTFYNNDGSGYEYRPMTVASFAIEHSLFRQRPHVSHFISVLLYAITVVVLFKLLRRWFVKQGDWFAFFICVLFVVHPLHTEVVCNIKSRDELLSMLGGLLTMYYAWRHFETKKWIYALVYPLAFGFGILSKHSILPLLAVFPLAFYFFSNAKLKQIAFYWLPLLIPILLTMLVQQKVLPHSHRELLLHENPMVSESMSLFQRMPTGFYVLGRYLLLHIWPDPLLYYYGYKTVPIVGWSSPLAIISALVHVAMGIYALMNFKKKSGLAFAIIVYLAFIAMFSNILLPSPGLIGERFTYGASLGFCIAAVWLLYRAFKVPLESIKWSTASVPRMIILGLAFLFAIRSMVRNEDWENKMTLYGHDMEYLDESAKANLLYGSLVSSSALRYQHYDSLQVVKHHFRRATEIYPTYATAWSNLGSTFFFLQEYDSAKYFFRKAIIADSSYGQGWFNMGMVYYNQAARDSAIYFDAEKVKAKALINAGNVDSAEHVMNRARARAHKMKALGRDSAIYAFKSAIVGDSSFTGSYDQLSRIYAEQKRYRDAINLLRDAAKNNRKADVPYMNLGALLMSVAKDTALAAKSFEIAAEINPKNQDRLRNLIAYYSGKKDFDKSAHYQKVLDEQIRLEKRIHPDETPANNPNQQFQPRGQGQGQRR